jgi:fructose-bisphosphate aldolase/2-amino-3,7-dideoxy-D-threo-hept-6-ulosonate synthase
MTPMPTSTQVGKSRRLQRLFSPSGKTLIVPVDDSLIFGPTGGLENVGSKLAAILSDPPNAVLAFSGALLNAPTLRPDVATIVNLSASTTRSVHTRKVQVATVHQAAQLGADAVAVHVNISSQYEHEMLRTLGRVAGMCESYGMPLLAIMYPRGENQYGDENYDEIKRTDRARYSSLVAHAARIGVDLGADIVKTQYTGDVDSFGQVVDACRPVPIVVAGGPLAPVESVLHMAYDIMAAGGAGVSFGRNVFGRAAPTPMISALKAIVHGGLAPLAALQLVTVD